MNAFHVRAAFRRRQRCRRLLLLLLLLIVVVLIGMAHGRLTQRRLPASAAAAESQVGAPLFEPTDGDETGAHGSGLRVADFPVGDPEQIQSLLREHVAIPARRLAARPPPTPGPIECRIGGAAVYLGPDSGRVVADRRQSGWSEAAEHLPWTLEYQEGDTYIVGPLGREGKLPAQLEPRRGADISPDGRLLLAVCVPEDGLPAPEMSGDEPCGGVVLWDREARQGWWVLHPNDSTRTLMGRILDADFYDGRHFLIETPNGYNGCVIACDAAKLPASVEGGGGWLGSALDYSVLSGTLCLWQRTCSAPWAMNAIVAVWDLGAGSEGWKYCGFALNDPGGSYAFGTHGRAVCCIESRDDDQSETRCRTVFVVLRGEKVHEYDLEAGELGDGVEFVVGASWAPDSHAVVVDVKLAEPPPTDFPSLGAEREPTHRLVVIDADSSETRTIASASSAFEPVWLAHGR
jgi:hypothetical protein